MSDHRLHDDARQQLGLPAGTLRIRLILSNTWGTQHTLECSADDQPFRWLLEGCTHFEQTNRARHMFSPDQRGLITGLKLYDSNFLVIDTCDYEIDVKFSRSSIL
jgi:hypothetical protein